MIKRISATVRNWHVGQLVVAWLLAATVVAAAYSILSRGSAYVARTSEEQQSAIERRGLEERMKTWRDRHPNAPEIAGILEEARGDLREDPEVVAQRSIAQADIYWRQVALQSWLRRLQFALPVLTLLLALITTFIWFGGRKRKGPG